MVTRFTESDLLNNTNRHARACVLFLIQRSAHLAALGVASILNRVIAQLVVDSTIATRILNWVDVGFLAYGADTRERPVIDSLLRRRVGQDCLVPISDLEASVVRCIDKKIRVVDEESGNVVEHVTKFPVWIDRVDPQLGSPLCLALRAAHPPLSQWVAENPTSYPPIVIIATDGTVDDGDPTDDAESLRELTTVDGPPLLLVNHFPPDDTYSQIRYPIPSRALPLCASQVLYRISSVLPGPHEMARQIYAKRYSFWTESLSLPEGIIGQPWMAGSKGYVCNGWSDLHELFGAQCRLYTDD